MSVVALVIAPSISMNSSSETSSLMSLNTNEIVMNKNTQLPCEITIVTPNEKMNVKAVSSLKYENGGLVSISLKSELDKRKGEFQHPIFNSELISFVSKEIKQSSENSFQAYGKLTADRVDFEAFFDFGLDNIIVGLIRVK